MKRLLLKSLLPGLLLGFLCGCDEKDQALRFDPRARTGKLKNGLTYYVRRNAKPKNRLALRLVVRVGSVLEEDDQQGLAHLLEHMAFNGTKRFDKQELVNYMESIGMRFGPGLNAYTSFDKTVYMLQVPVDKEGAVDTGFKILSDWAFGIKNEDEEINQERGVVIEEWRLGRGAGQRLRDKHFPVLFKGSKYADRLPIGKKKVLDTFKPQRVRDFYQEWYRPNMMAVIAVGDVDADNLLESIRTHFGGVEAEPVDRTKTTFEVPDHPTTLISIAGDKEATSSSVSVYYKGPVQPHRTVADYRAKLVDSLAFGMLNQRLEEIRQRADAPFLGAHASSASYVRTKRLVTLGATVKDTGFLDGLESILVEGERVRRFGFTKSELERMKAERMKSVERAFRERLTTESVVYAGRYTQNFLLDNVDPGIEAGIKLHRYLLPRISVSEVSERAKELFRTDNRVVLVSGPEKEGVKMPDRAMVQATFVKAEKAEIEPYVDAVSDRPLLARDLKPGSITKRDSLPGLGITVWRLSNGVQVLLKATDFKKDEIRVSAFKPGGHSLVPDKDFIAASTAASIVSECGFGDFSKLQLKKKLAGKTVYARPYISELRAGLSGGCRPKDLETMMKLVHLGFTAPRRDPDAYAAYRNRMRTWVEHRLAKPETAFWDAVKWTLVSKHPRHKPWTPEMVDGMDMERSLAVYRKLTESATGYVFMFVGNLDFTETEKLVCKYLASLPGSEEVKKWKDVGVRPPKGKVEVTVKKGQDPKARAYRVYQVPFKWSAKEKVRITAMLHILRIRLREKLRETIGGTYYTAVYPVYGHYPYSYCESRISFGCAPDKVDELLGVVEKDVADLQKELVDDIYLTKAKQIMLQEWRVNREKNGFWMSLMDSWQWHGDDPKVTVNGFEGWVNELTKEDIRKIARKYLDTPNVATIFLKPEKKAAE